MAKCQKPIILFVDGGQKNLKLFEAMLSSDDYEILMAESGQEVLSKVRAGRPDLIVLNLVMPGVEGLEVARKLKQDPGSWTVPLVAVMAMSGDPERIRAWEAGVDFVLSGSINAEELKAKIGDLLQAATERKRSEINYKAVLSAAFDGFWISDREGRFLDVDDAYLALMGYRREEFLKLNLKDIEVHEDSGGIAGHIEKIIQTGNGIFETRHRRSDGSPVDVEVSINFFDFEGGRFYAFWRDVSERKQAEEALKRLYEELRKKNKRLNELDQLKDNFISTVSHELRTPLAIIKQFSGIIADEIPGKLTEDQKQYVGIIKEGTDRLIRLINDLLDISKMESGTVVLKRTLVEMGRMTNKVIFALRPQAAQKGIELCAVFQEPLPSIYFDEEKIVQVLTNLIGNATKFTPQNGHITVTITEREKEVEFSVSDTGPGISPEDTNKVFKRFQQFGRTAGSGSKGTGLGLAISKQLVEMHGGRIWVESKEGAGSRFLFTLPKYDETESLQQCFRDTIAIAAKDGADFSVFIIGLAHDPADESEKAVMRGFLSKLGSQLEHSGALRDYQVFPSQNGIVFLMPINKKNLCSVIARAQKKIKEWVFEDWAGGIRDLSYGYATYPEDGATGDALLHFAHSHSISEMEARKQKKILIADDDPISLKLLECFLGQLGYGHVEQAHDGSEVLLKVKAVAFDAVILDMQMPMSGYEVIGSLKENVRTKDLPILILSGYALDEGDVTDYISAKAIPKLQKPCKREELEKWMMYLA